MIKLDIEKALNEGKIIFLKDSNAFEKRLYRFNDNTIEYSDDNKLWKKSNMKLDDLKDNEWIVYEK